MTQRTWPIACLALCAAILSIELLFPLSWDNWVYQTIGNDMVRFGHLPYLGAWDLNFPGIMYLHAISIMIFGTSEIGFRIFDFCFELATCWLIYRLDRYVLSEIPALLSSVCYALLYVSLAWQAAGQRDAFAMFFLAAGILAMVRARSDLHRTRSWLLAALAGALLICTFLIRPTFGIYSAAVFFVDMWCSKRFTRNSLALLIGSILPIVLVLLSFALHKNGLRELYRSGT